MLRIGWGQERNANGGAALSSRPVAAGARRPLRRAGQRRHRQHVGRRRDARAGAGPRRRPTDPTRRTLPMHQIGQWMAPGSDDPCEVLFVQGANPLVMCPDTQAVVAAFARDDVFTVVHEQVLTDTTRYADVVLPATTSFEIHDATSSYGAFAVMPVMPVIPRVGESRSNDEVGHALATALGYDWYLSSPLDAHRRPRPACRRACPRVSSSTPSRPTAARALVDPNHGVPRWVPVARDAAVPAHAHLARQLEAGELDVRRVPEPVAGRPAPPRRRRGSAGSTAGPDACGSPARRAASPCRSTCTTAPGPVSR